MYMSKISIIVPCYNEEEVLEIFYNKISEVAKKIDADFEFIFIDDGSNDKTLEILKEYSRHDERVRFVSFSRNFGKEAAMYAGLNESTGDYIAILDADLQDPPDLRLLNLESMIVLQLRERLEGGSQFFVPSFQGFFIRLLIR